ncbi:MAG: hypothetical protein M3362_04115 [Acidobacteriota bacterium]|nr:hypothetical protein [Acidobacteriota bacterium]
MHKPLKSILFFAAPLMLSLVFSANQRAQAHTIIDTTPSSPPNFVFGFEESQSLTTVGQVITAPTTDTKLQDFTFYIEALNAPGTLKFYIYAWDGTKAQGAELFHSAPLTISANSRFPAVTVDTGGLSLTAGAQYVIFASVAELPGQPFLLFEPAASDVYSGGSVVTLRNGSDTSKWTTDEWILFTSYDFAFKATFVCDQQLLQTLQDQINTLTGQNQTLQSQVGSLTQQLQSSQDHVSTLTVQNQTLTQQNQTLSEQNQTLQNQLASDNQVVSNLSSKVSQLQAQLNQQSSSINTLVNSIELDLRRAFNNPRFSIPGATPQQRLQNLINALLNLNKGRKEGIYQGLGGKQ